MAHIHSREAIAYSCPHCQTQGKVFEDTFGRMYHYSFDCPRCGTRWDTYVPTHKKNPRSFFVDRSFFDWVSNQDISSDV